jgi:hypothetical protein
MTEWKLVPVEPTDAMLEAMQAAGLAAFDADIDASLGDTPLDPTHARRAIWRAALNAAPEAPDHRAAMRMAVNSLVSLMNAHFPLERELLTDEQFFAAGDAVAALEKALGERE